MTDKLTPLLPCPFCGGEAEVARIWTPQQSKMTRCKECSCSIYTDDPAYDSWNTRQALSSPTPSDEVFETLLTEYDAAVALRREVWTSETIPQRNARVIAARTRILETARGQSRTLAAQEQADNYAGCMADIDAIVAAYRKRMPDDEWLNLNYPLKGAQKQPNGAELVERVARAIYDTDALHKPMPQCRIAAKAAIAALRKAGV